MHYTFETTQALLEGMLQAGGGVFLVFAVVWCVIKVLSLPAKLFD
jgi:hypothetical protein